MVEDFVVFVVAEGSSRALLLCSNRRPLGLRHEKSDDEGVDQGQEGREPQRPAPAEGVGGEPPVERPQERRDGAGEHEEGEDDAAGGGQEGVDDAGGAQ